MQVPDLKPRRRPRQARSQASVDAILEATAHLLAADGYASVTTNHIAERAGVSIGTLYQFFPGKEAVVVALAERNARRQFETVLAELPVALARKAPDEALDLLVRRIMAMLAADRRLHAVLLRDVPFLRDLPIVRDTVDALTVAARAQLEPLRAQTHLEDLEVETWLIGRMAYEAIVAIAVFGEGPASLDRSADAFVRLLLRMVGEVKPPRRRAARGGRSR